MKLKQLAGKVVLWTKKNSPEILLGVNVTSSIAAVGFAIKATPKAAYVVQDHKEKIGLIHQLKDGGEKFNETTGTYEEYTPEQVRKDLLKVYGKTAWELTKLYAPSGICLTSSIVAAFGEHKIMATRNAALATSLELLKTQFDKYRERVKEAVGEDKEKDIYENNKEKTGTDAEGKEIKEKVSEGNHNPFEFWFDESCREWNPNTSDNVIWLLQKQEWFNNKFIRNGFVFLDDVLMTIGITEDIIGKERMKMAHFYGWRLDRSNDKIDNHISFGLTDEQGNLTRDVIFAKGTNAPGILLNFNVDGNIFNTKNSSDYLDCNRNKH